MNARRDAIARTFAPVVDQPHGYYLANAILALPIEQARDRVVEAARAWSAEPYAGGVPTLLAAVAELDALSIPNEADQVQERRRDLAS